MMKRHLVLVFAILALGLALPAAPALAGARVTVKTKYYTISGSDGYMLFKAMNRKGPRHGFLKKAMAQTQYKTSPRGKMVWKDGVCRVKKGGYNLQITYVYPKINGRISGTLDRRWKKFMRHTVSHEKYHGKIAVQMANILDKQMRSFAMKDRSNCRRAVQRLKNDISAIYKTYEARQRDFDKREHRKGGPVEKSVLALVKQ